MELNRYLLKNDEAELFDIEKDLAEFLQVPFVKCAYDAIMSHISLDEDELAFRKTLAQDINNTSILDFVINFEIYQSKEDYDKNSGGVDGEVHELHYLKGNGDYIIVTSIDSVDSVKTHLHSNLNPNQENVSMINRTAVFTDFRFEHPVVRFSHPKTDDFDAVLDFIDKLIIPGLFSFEKSYEENKINIPELTEELFDKIIAFFPNGIQDVFLHQICDFIKEVYGWEYEIKK